jgi:hypothetical protein
MTITLTHEEAQQVLDAMIPYQQKVIATTKEYGVTVSVNNEIETAIETLRSRLSAPEPEPVAKFVLADGLNKRVKLIVDDLPIGTLFYTTPPQREWQGLTDEERYLGDARSDQEIEYAKTIEAKLKEKNASHL